MPDTKKPLGFWMATALVIGNMIGSGIFLLPASLGAYGDISLFGRLSRSFGMPVFGIYISSLLATILMAANYTRGLVGLFTFAILLATLFTLLPYLFSTMAALLIAIKEKQQPDNAMKISIVAILAFAFSVWAVAGAGQETIYLGFLFLISSISSVFETKTDLP